MMNCLNAPHISVLVLLILLFVFSVGGDSRSCFYCIWIAPSPDTPQLPSAVNKSDVCRPGFFDPRVVHRDTCPFDCLTMVLYDYIETGKLGELYKYPVMMGFLQDRIKSSFRATDPNRTAVMTVFYRGCSRDPHLKHTALCEERTVKEEMHHFQQKCYCPTPLCNGEATASPTTTVPSSAPTPNCLRAFLLPPLLLLLASTTPPS